MFQHGRIPFLIFVVILSLVRVEAGMGPRLRFQPPQGTIVLIPGIGGSSLYSRDITLPTTDSYHLQRVWVDTSTSQNSRAQRLISNYDEYGQTFPGGRYQIFAPTDDCGLFSIRNLAPGSLLGDLFTSRADYFGPLIDHYLEIGYRPCINLFGFPYDWRYSTNHTSTLIRLHQLLAPLSNLNIITHSMGGILFENYLRRYPIPLNTQWIPISTPFKGAGGNMLKAFLTGYNMENIFLSDSVAKEIVIRSFSAYELLPQSHLMLSPTLTLITGRTYVPVNYINHFRSNPSFKPDRIPIRTCFAVNIGTYYIGNSRTPTPYSVLYNTETGALEFNMVKGDGTVPYPSSAHRSCHSSYGSESDVNVTADHVSILAHPVTWAIADYTTGDQCVTRGWYGSGTNRFYIDNSIIYYHSISGVRYVEQNDVWYIIPRDCMSLTREDDNAYFERQIGNECSTTVWESVDTATATVWCIYGFSIRISHSGDKRSLGIFDTQSRKLPNEIGRKQHILDDTIVGSEYNPCPKGYRNLESCIPISPSSEF